MKNAFIRFLNLKHTMEVSPAELDSTALQLLEICELRDHIGKRLTVTDAMKLDKVASPATIHRKLIQLVDAEYLSLEYEGQNRRTKYLTPTGKSHEYFTKLGEFISQSSQS